MDWINENLQILTTLGSALGVFIFLRIGAKRDTKEIKLDLVEMKKDIKHIDQRLNKLEGAFEERGRWESSRTGTGEKK